MDPIKALKKQAKKVEKEVKKAGDAVVKTVESAVTNQGGGTTTKPSVEPVAQPAVGTPANTADSANRLTDFDMCLALTQKAINSQLLYAWKAWKRRKAIQDTIEIPVLKADGTPSRYGLTAKLAPLTINLNIKDAKLAQVLVTLTLESGEVRYYDEAEEAPATYDIEDWSVSFVTNLDKKPVDLDLLKQIDPDAKNTVADVIKRSGLPDSVFSIEYLCMKFTEVDLMLVDNKNVQIPDDVPKAAREKALSCLNRLLQGDMGNFMLGVVVRRNHEQATPTFALTDFIFDVHANWARTDASTLSYLGMLSRRPLPADTTKARVALQDNWVSPALIDGSEGLVSGIMAIRGAKLLDEYLIPSFKQALGLDPIVQGFARKFEWSESARKKQDDVFHHVIDKKKGYWITIEPVLGKNYLQISGKVWSSVYYEQQDQITHSKIGSLVAEGEQVLKGTVTLTARGSGAEFALDAEPAHSFDPYKTTRSDSSGISDVGEFATKIPKWLGFGGKTLTQMLEGDAREMGTRIQQNLDKVLNSIEVDLTHHDFIPPGGGVFDFQNVRFSGKTADLVFEVIYRAP